MQILVVVANIQVRSLKTEVEKVSTLTAVECGSVDPKILANALYHREGEVYFSLGYQKGIGLIFPDQYTAIAVLLSCLRGNAFELCDVALRTS